MTIASTLGQNETQYATDDCLEEIINNTRAVRQDSEKNRFKLQVNNFLAEVASGSLVISSDLIGSIEKRIADIDKLMSEQLSLIMHATEFQKIESAWTGLYKLVQSSVTENVKYCGFRSGGLRFYRRCAGWDYFRLADAPHGIAEHCA